MNRIFSLSNPFVKKITKFTDFRTSMHEVKTGSFIFFRANAIARDVCDETIKRFEADSRVQASHVYPDGLNLRVRRASEINFTTVSGWRDLEAHFLKSMDETFCQLSSMIPVIDRRLEYRHEGFVLQRTRPGEFFDWHYDFIFNTNLPRHFSILWYLNDIEEGGETEFHYQQIKIKPQAGSMLFFPSYWTHWHRGVSPKATTKYLVTNWLTAFTPEKGPP